MKIEFTANPHHQQPRQCGQVWRESHIGLYLLFNLDRGLLHRGDPPTHMLWSDGSIGEFDMTMNTADLFVGWLEDMEIIEEDDDED